ncbi:hypothetical protein [Confluentibacter flavum]|uniref:Uncharacterized protein n=1 Tax=Confluentibacter flavum TaxID=1909700 RepID=A0A2N3HGV4_9FLAO|nr:hypothetical protein [Confluentibacter flavum]PKQ44200.1 hypothetical protein CSW08_13945 [Confluentibacter flavum]
MNGTLRVWERGFSEGHEPSELAQAKSEASKQATNFVLAKTSNFLYTALLAVVFSLRYYNIEVNWFIFLYF